MTLIDGARVKLTFPVHESYVMRKRKETSALTATFYKEAGYVLQDILYAIGQVPYGSVAYIPMQENTPSRRLREVLVNELQKGFPDFSITGETGWHVRRPSGMTFIAIEAFFARQNSLQ